MGCSRATSTGRGDVECGRAPARSMRNCTLSSCMRVMIVDSSPNSLQYLPCVTDSSHSLDHDRLCLIHGRYLMLCLCQFLAQIQVVVDGCRHSCIGRLRRRAHTLRRGNQVIRRLCVCQLRLRSCRTPTNHYFRSDHFWPIHCHSIQVYSPAHFVGQPTV